jgi:Uma2 family endonuclease
MLKKTVGECPMYQQTDPPRPPKDYLPTMYDLPSEDPEEPGLPDEFHLWQPRLLDETFRPTTYSATEILTASDLNLYYDLRHPLWYKRPDWYAVVGIPKLYDEKDLRLSYVMWQEGISPQIVLEFLSPGTEKEDLGQTLRIADQPPTKWEVYERILRIPYYVVFDRYTDTLRTFVIQANRYVEQDLAEPRLWIPDLEMGLGLWQGSYNNIDRLWLRWYDANGQWIPTPAEQAQEERQRAEQERQRAEQEQQRAEQERQRADLMAAKLRELGIDPNQL